MKSYLSTIAIISTLSLGAGISPLYAQDSSVNPSALSTEWHSEAGNGQMKDPSEYQLREILASVSREINISFLDQAAQRFLAKTIFWRQESQMSGTEDRTGLVNFVAKLENVQLQLKDLGQIKDLGQKGTPDNFKIGMMLADFHLPINHSNFEKAQAVIKEISSDQANENDAMIAVFLAFKKKYTPNMVQDALISLHTAALNEDQTRYLMHQIMDPKQTNFSLEDLIKQAKAHKFSHYGQKQDPTDAQLKEALASVSKEINISGLDQAAQHFLAETIFWRQQSGLPPEKNELLTFFAKIQAVQAQLKKENLENAPDNFKIGMMLKDFNVTINKYSFKKATTVLGEIKADQANKNDAMIAVFLAFKKKYTPNMVQDALIFLHAAALSEGQTRYLMHQIMDPKQTNLSLEDLIKQAKAHKFFHYGQKQDPTDAQLKEALDSVDKEINISVLDKTAQHFLAETIFWRQQSGLPPEKNELLTIFAKIQAVQDQLKKENLENTPDNFKIGMMLEGFHLPVNDSNFKKAQAVIKDISSAQPNKNSDQQNKNDAMIAVFLAFKKNYTSLMVKDALNSLHAAALSESQTRYLMHKIMDPDPKQTNLSLEDLIKQAKAQKFSSNDHSSTQTSGNFPVQTSGKPPLQTSGKTPVQTSGKTPVQTSGNPPVQTSGKTPVQTSGKTPVQTSVKTTVQATTSESTDQKKKEHSRR